MHGKERLPGAVGRKAIHFSSRRISKEAKIRDLWIDTGRVREFRPRSESEISLRSNPVSSIWLVIWQWLARSIIRRASLFIGEAMRLLSQEGGLHQAVGVYSVATVQEEIGSRGAQTAGFALGAQSGLAVDMGHARDVPGNESQTIRRSRYRKRTGIARGANTNQRSERPHSPRPLSSRVRVWHFRGQNPVFSLITEQPYRMRLLLIRRLLSQGPLPLTQARSG